MKTSFRALTLTLCISAVTLYAALALKTGLHQSFTGKSTLPQKAMQLNTKTITFKSKPLDSGKTAVINFSTQQIENVTTPDSTNFIFDQKIVDLEEPRLESETITIDSTSYGDINADDNFIEIDTTDLPK